MAYFPDWERNWHLMLWYLAGKWKVVGGPFVAWACGSKRSHGMRVPPPPSSYSTDLASEEHTRPYQTSVWQPSCCGFCWERSRSLKPATVGLAPRNRSDVSGHRPDHMDQKICRGEGFGAEDNIDLDNIPYSYNITGWDRVARYGLCNEHRARNAQMVGAANVQGLQGILTKCHSDELSSWRNVCGPSNF